MSFAISVFSCGVSVVKNRKSLFPFFYISGLFLRAFDCASLSCCTLLFLILSLKLRYHTVIILSTKNHPGAQIDLSLLVSPYFCSFSCLRAPPAPVPITDVLPFAVLSSWGLELIVFARLSWERTPLGPLANGLIFPSHPWERFSSGLLFD